MGAKPTIEEIQEAIKASGYLMEQEVADVFESLNYRVITNWAFEDQDQGTSREIDAFAFKRIYTNAGNNFNVDIEFICECKNNSNAFVFIERSRTEHEIGLPDPVEYHFPIQKVDVVNSRNEAGVPLSVSHVPAFQYLGLGERHYYYQQSDKGVQFASIIRDKDKWKASQEHLYDQILYPVVKALRYRQQELPFSRTMRPDRDLTFSDHKYIHLAFPVVVLSGDLYRINPFDREIFPHKTDHVSLIREFKATNLRGTFLVDFVKRDFLQTFVEKKVETFGKWIGELIESNPYAFMVREADSYASF